MKGLDITTAELGLDKIKKASIDVKGGIDRPKFKLVPGKLNDQAGREALKEAIDTTIQRTAAELKLKLNEAMSSNLWGEMGDIIDSGDLRDSLNVAINGDTVEISYDSPYANLAHYGGYVAPYGNVNINKVYIPGRPWVEAVFAGNGPVDPIDVTEIWEQSK